MERLQIKITFMDEDPSAREVVLEEKQSICTSAEQRLPKIVN